MVIGGHTNTFLWSGDRPEIPDFPVPMGPYPTVVEGPSGKNTLVLQTNGYGRFLGDITVTFDLNGQVVSWSKGQPILLDKSVAKDPELQAQVDAYGRKLGQFMTKPIGRTEVELYGGRPACRLVECSMGSFIGDALVDQTGASIAISNSGSFKGSLHIGKDVLSSLSFEASF